MTLSVYQANIVNDAGDILPGADIEVILESTGLPATIYSTRAGAALANPFTSDINGFAQFYANSGEYKVTATSGVFSQTWRYVRVGDGGSYDTGTGPGQIPLNSDISNKFVLKLPILNSAIISTDLISGQSVSVKEHSVGNGGGATWDVVLTSSVTPNTYNIVACTGLPELSLQLRVSRKTVDIAEIGATAVSIDVAPFINHINSLGLDAIVSGVFTHLTKISIDVAKGSLIGVGGSILNTDLSVAADTELLHVYSSTDYANRPAQNLTRKISNISFDFNSLGTVKLGGVGNPESSEILFENGSFIQPFRFLCDVNAWRLLMSRWPIVRVKSKILEFNAAANGGEVMQFNHGWYVDSGADWIFNDGQWMFQGCSLPAGAPAGFESAMKLSGNALVSFTQGNIEYQPGQEFVGVLVTESSRFIASDTSITITSTEAFDRPVIINNDDGVVGLRNCSLPLFGDYAYETNSSVREVVGGNSKKVTSHGCYPRAGFTVANWEKGAIVSHQINVVSNPSGQIASLANWTTVPYGAGSGSVVFSTTANVPNSLVFSRSFNILAPAGGGGAMQQVIPVSETGRYFQFGFWARASTGITNVEIKFRRADTGVISSLTYALDAAITTAWKWYAVIDAIPAETREVFIEYNAQEAPAVDVDIHHVVYGLI